MNEFLRTFVRKTIKSMVFNVPEYEIRVYALGWLDKGILTEDDLAELDALLVQVPEKPEEDISEIPDTEVNAEVPDTEAGMECPTEA